MLSRRALVSMTGLIVFSIVCAVLFTSKEAARNPLGRIWPAGQYVSMDQIDHVPFDELLQKYVDPRGMVNYSAWKASANDRKKLATYLQELSKAAPGIKSSREAQLAFWINAYNATTLEGILQVYPTSSILDHTAKLSGYNIWKDLPLLVGGKPYSLDAMEHEVLRKMEEPRIHFAIVCASIGCPRLNNRAYQAKQLDEQLSGNTTDFFSRRQNFYVDQSGTMHVSSILDWFGDDFGSTQQSRFMFLQKYLPENARTLAVNPLTRVEFQDYNWSLNEQKPSADSTSERKPAINTR